ncbi:hypothetical protein [Bacillus pseudomycoides]|uniref:hypothetical protein n=1 Tax=Bacillus pseudomycoides TaxID=64104 RepID=UPI0015CF45F7|nr:hypothetical protein [Bacillus pseudomycoides]
MRIKKDSVIFPLPSEDLIFKKEEDLKIIIESALETTFVMKEEIKFMQQFLLSNL